jgi:hypothetical protein
MFWLVEQALVPELGCRPHFLQERFMTERLTQIRYDELPPEVQPLADDILKVSSAALGGPYNALLRSP